MSKVELQVVDEPREIVLTLGEGGGVAQRRLRGQRFWRDENGDNIAEKPFEQDLSAEETAQVVDSGAFALNDKLTENSTTIGELKATIAAADLANAAKDKLIKRLASIDAQRATAVAEAVQNFQDDMAKIVE